MVVFPLPEVGTRQQLVVRSLSIVVEEVVARLHEHGHEQAGKLSWCFRWKRRSFT